MSEVIAEHTTLSAEDERWLQTLVEEWQLLADLAFSDLVLWVPEPDANVFWAAAQIRPTTGPTALVDDVVGDLIAYSPEHLVAEAFLSGQITQTSDGKLQAGIPVGVHALPVGRNGRVIAVVEQHTNQLAVRSAGALERAYLQTGTELADMVRIGSFPTPGRRPAVVLRAGDGFIQLDPDGDVLYASPNALSAYRRLGLTADLVDAHLARLTDDLVPRQAGPVDESLRSALSGRQARETEVVAGEAHLLLRSLPLTPGGEHTGAIVLCRDVTDLRSRERELMSKDATIREIHHRVKNNLQTVAALLRMQSRRIASPEAKQALRDAMSRVASIAIVHETLSQTFDEVVHFDAVADHILTMVGDVATHEGAVTARRLGSFGQVSAAVAANLSLVMTELCQNAIEHGLAAGGEVTVNSWVEGEWLNLQVWDDGEGLPPDFSLQNRTSLGLSIVTSLVDELGGTFALGPRWDSIGTLATVRVPMSAVRRVVAHPASATG